MPKLRLLVTPRCTRSCPGCCNNSWDLDALPQVQDFSPYDEVLLTGGEPMLVYNTLPALVQRVRAVNPHARIYMYTAMLHPALIKVILPIIDGITLTLHEPADAVRFHAYLKTKCFPHNKNLRLNVFEGVDISHLNLKGWIVKDHMVWIKDCPLPEGEVFMRL